MDFTYTPEQEAWRQEVRAFLKEHVTQELIERCAEDNSQWDADLYQTLADAGYLGVSIPKELGGQGKSFSEKAIFDQELERANVPLGIGSVLGSTSYWVANVIGYLGTKEQKEHFLPRILSGEFTFSVGLTEPGCGSDLAAVQTLAIEDGDEFVVTGSKTFNSAHLTNHLVTVLRTNPNVPKHKGISLLLIDLRHPQISISPFHFISKWRRNIVYLDGVRVPRSCLLGRKDMGWYDLMSVMHLERTGVAPDDTEKVFDELVAYVKHTERDGQPLASYPDVRHALAEMKWELTIGRLLHNRVVWLQETGQLEEAHVQASLQKVYVSESIEHVANRAMEIIGPSSLLEWVNANETGKALSPLRGTLTCRYADARVLQIAGGTSEIQRSIIARRGLGLPT